MEKQQLIDTLKTLAISTEFVALAKKAINFDDSDAAYDMAAMLIDATNSGISIHQLNIYKVRELKAMAINAAIVSNYDIFPTQFDEIKAARMAA